MLPQVAVCVPLTTWCLYTIFDTPTLSTPYLTFAMMVCYSLGTGLFLKGSYRESMGVHMSPTCRPLPALIYPPSSTRPLYLPSSNRPLLTAFYPPSTALHLPALL